MTMKKICSVLLLCLILLSGCVTLSNEAATVMPHRQYSKLLDGCQPLGNVTCKLWNGGNGGQDWNSIVTTTLRQAAYDQFGADAVVIMDVSVTWTYVYGSGIAYKCKK